MRSLLILGSLALLLNACKVDPVTFTDNDPPYYDKIPTVLVENYVNRLFIDLIGREPLDSEMSLEVDVLQAANLSESSRVALIQKLQTSTAFVEGDTSYAHAYYFWLYESCKARVLEGASEFEITEFLNLARADSSRAVALGDADLLAMAIAEIKKYRKLLAGKGYKPGEPILIDSIYRLMIDNGVYDEINMNSFNFINATFDNLYYRFPTTDEFDRGYDMVEFDMANNLFGYPGSSKQDYIDIIITNEEFYEGVVRWVFLSLMAREPSTAELTEQMDIFYADRDYQDLQLRVMKTDEYADLGN